MLGVAGGATPPTYYYRSGHAAPTAVSVYTVGDSITFQYKDTVASRLASRGNYAGHSSSFGGIGILDSARRDVGGVNQWGTQITSTDCDICIFNDVGNYNDPIPGISWGTDAFFTAWQTNVQHFANQLTAVGIRLAIQSNQLFTNSEDSNRAGKRLTEIYRTIANGTAGVVLLDFYNWMGGDVFWPEMRNIDGVHLSNAGIIRASQIIERWVLAGAPVTNKLFR